jgi:LysR family glycine cleavage system transcriptional activator
MSDRPTRLPPLTALRAFEAAARHMSFAKAADELSVTPAALSYQIKQLEDHLGLPLFHRLNRAVALTEAGKRLRPGVAEGFDALRGAVHALDSLREGRGLTVTAGPAFTAKWLAPRIYHFVGREPDIEVRIVASLRVMDFDRDGIDAAMRFGWRANPAHFSKPLFDEVLTPMCAPALAATLRDPADLRDAPLIHDDSMNQLGTVANWGDWLAAAGVERADWTRGARLSNADHALSAAAEGGAVALGRVSLAEPELRTGRLVAPFPLGIDPEARLRFICPKGAETGPSMATFLAWIDEELAATPDPLPGIEVVRVPRLVAAAGGD